MMLDDKPGSWQRRVHVPGDLVVLSPDLVKAFVFCRPAWPTVGPRSWPDMDSHQVIGNVKNDVLIVVASSAPDEAHVPIGLAGMQYLVLCARSGVIGWLDDVGRADHPSALYPLGWDVGSRLSKAATREVIL